MLEAAKRGGGRQPVSVHGTDAVRELPASTSTPSRHVARGEAVAALHRAIRRLPRAQRRVVQLYDLDQRSAGEVGTAMSRSIGAIFMLRARAHRRLCEIMGNASDYLWGVR